MLQGLVLALGVVFSVIFLGYGLRVTKILTGEHAAGVSRLVGRVGLPSVLFLAMSTIDFDGVQWLFILGMALARFLVFWVVIGLSLLLGSGGRASLPEAALRAVFATQSNDFALGLPVMSAIYPPEIVQYLYLIAALQLAVLNPIGFTLVEYGMAKRRNNGAAQRVKMGPVLFKVIKNPIVFMTILGLLGNLAFSSDPPPYFQRLLRTLGNVYSAGALLCLGGSMAGKFKGMAGKALLTPLLLTGAKTLLLPIMNTVLVSAFDVKPFVDADGQETELSLVGFILGTIPTSATLFIYAVDFGILVSEMAQGVVVCTILSAPLMMITAQLALLNLEGMEDYETLLHDTSVSVTFGSIVGVVLVMAIRLGSPVGRTLSNYNILLLASTELFFCLALQTCAAHSSVEGSKVRYLFIWAGIYATRITVLMSSLSIAVTYAYGEAVNRRQQLPRILVGIVIFGGMMTMAALTLRVPEQGLIDEYCWFGLKDQPQSRYIMETIQNSVFLAVLMWCTVRLQSKSHAESVQHTIDVNFDAGLLENDAYRGSKGSPQLAAANSTENMSAYREAERANQTAAAAASDDHAQPFDLQADPNASSRDIDEYVEESDDEFEDDTAETLDVDDAREVASNAVKVTYRDRIFLVLQCISALLHVVVSIWTLTSPTNSGIFAQVAFIDVFLVGFQGLIIFFVFGTKYRYIRPIVHKLRNLRIRLRRHFVDGAETNNFGPLPLSELDPVVQDAVVQFEPLKANFQARFVRNHRHRLQRYPKVFLGRDLVSYLVTMGLAQDRAEATVLGKHLCTAGQLQHVHLDHFEDERRFYRFYEAPRADETPSVSDTPNGAAEPEIMEMRDITSEKA